MELKDLQPVSRAVRPVNPTRRGGVRRGKKGIRSRIASGKRMESVGRCSDCGGYTVVITTSYSTTEACVGMKSHYRQQFTHNSREYFKARGHIPRKVG